MMVTQKVSLLEIIDQTTFSAFRLLM